jgi:hypothetical protein
LQLLQGNVNISADLWSFGLLVFWLLTDFYVFDPLSRLSRFDVLDALRNDLARPEIPADLHHQVLADYIARCWTGKGTIAHSWKLGFWGGLEVLDYSQSDLKLIGDDAFRNSRKLKVVKLGRGLTNIGDGAFGGCSALTGLVLPDEVKEIGRGAFSWCTNLKAVKLGGGLSIIRDWTFSPC